jgi:hypothetical protein
MASDKTGPIETFIRRILAAAKPVTPEPIESVTQNYETKRRAMCAAFRGDLAQALVTDLNQLFTKAPYAGQQFQAMPPRGLRTSDQKAGVIFDFPLPSAVNSNDPKCIKNLNPAHAPPKPVRKHVKAPVFKFNAASGVARHLSDPDTQVLEIQNGKTGRIDSMLFVAADKVVISVAAQKDTRLTSALTQARELHPAYPLHPRLPKNSERSVTDLVQQIRLRYASHLAETRRVISVSAKEEASARTDHVISRMQQPSPAVAFAVANAPSAMVQAGEEQVPAPAAPAQPQQVAGGDAPGQWL